MSLENIYDNFRSLLEANKKLLEYVKYILLVFFIAFPIHYLYQSYVFKREAKAEVMLSDSLKDYDQALSLNISNADEKQIDSHWQDVHALFELAQQKNSSASLEAYMAVFNAQILARLGKLDEAKKVLDKALVKLDGSPYSGLYRLFEALLAIETEDSLGEEKLIALASDQTNPDRDAALYFLGIYQLSKGNKESAVMSFNNIELSVDKNSYSPWKHLAENQLNLIS